jgi:hypothetical protein
MRTILLFVAAGTLALGQGLDLKILDRFADKSEEQVNITLDENLLRLGTALLGASKEGAEAKEVVSGLKSINVRSYKFAAEGAYNAADLEPIWAQLKQPGWSQIVDAREKNQRSGIFLRTGAKDVGGIAIVTYAPREITVVSILGSIDVEKLGKLGGKFGIPEIDVKTKKPEPKKAEPAKKNEDEI